MFHTIHTKRVQLHNKDIMIDYDNIDNNNNYKNFIETDVGTEEIIDKFELNKYQDIFVYERKKMRNVIKKSEELKMVLEFFNKYHGYNGDFTFDDFEALMPQTLEKVTDKIWRPVYDDFICYKKNDFDLGYNDGLNCVCSQDCGSLFLIRNKKTDKYFGVGSICISKFINQEFHKQISKMKRNINKISCSKCYKKTNENVLNKNQIKDKKFCNKCIKNVKVIFDIKYKEKDEFKKYGIRWDNDSKYWYMNGAINEKLNEKVDKIEFNEELLFIEED